VSSKSKLSLSNFLLSTVKVYERNRDKFRSAENDYAIIDELADKLIHETGDRLTKELATKTLKGIVESMHSMRLKGEI